MKSKESTYRMKVTEGMNKDLADTLTGGGKTEQTSC